MTGDKINDIIRVAKDLFSKYGFAKTTMTDIAAQLEISKASLYYYFDDKESILIALAKLEQEQFVSEIRVLMKQPSSAVNKLTDYPQKRLEMLQKMFTLMTNKENYNAIRPLFGLIAYDFKITEIEMIREIIQQGTEAGEFVEMDFDQYAELFVHVLRGLREVVFAKYGKNESEVRFDDNYTVFKKQSHLFTEMFIHSISK